MEESFDFNLERVLDGVEACVTTRGRRVERAESMLTHESSGRARTSSRVQQRARSKAGMPIGYARLGTPRKLGGAVD